MSDTSEPGPTTAVSPERRALVDAARAAWSSKLVDFSRRNALLFYSDRTSGTLDLTAETEVNAALLRGAGVRLPGSVRTQVERDEMQKKLKAIRATALANSEERGIQTLFVAFGMATWRETDGGRDGNAPVVLLPVTLAAVGRESANYRLEPAGEPVFNPTLAARLRAFGVDAEWEQLLIPPPAERATEAEPIEPGDGFDPRDAFDRLRTAAAAVAGFGVHERTVLGNFSFQKMAIVADLEKCGELLADHDIVAALAGDVQARAAVITLRTEVDPEALDGVSPADDFTILDADSSQLRVIRAALGGSSGVVQGPPGTGKSQTIANLIASLAAEGKSVLFVAEKRAALEVVLARLDAAGLGSLALDLHGADIKRKMVAARLKASLGTIRSAQPVATGDIRQQLADRRRELSQHADRLHRRRDPSGMSVYAIEAELLALPGAATNDVRWRGADLATLTAEAIEEARQLLAACEAESRLFLRNPGESWAHAIIPTGPEALAASELARTADAQVAAVGADARHLAELSGAPPPASFASHQRRAEAAAAVAHALTLFQPGLLSEDLAALDRDLAPAQGGGIGRLLASWFNGRYRSALGRARTLASQPAAPAVLAANVGSARRAVETWRAMTPAPFESGIAAVAPEIADRAVAAAAVLAELGPIFGRDLTAGPLDELERWLHALATDRATPLRLPALFQREQRLAALGVERLIEHLRAESIAPEQWTERLRYAWLESCREDVLAQEAELAGFNGRNQERRVREFAALDRELIRLNASRIRRAWAERAVATMNQQPEQAALVERECEKQARHLPVRRLVASAADVLTALCPCFMASPLSVSQLLGSGGQYFDYVIFDEASQVLPEDAITSLVRGRHAIVAGDRHQLPPTQFFADSGGEDDDGDTGDEGVAATAGFESLLDQMTGFLAPWSLEWHYRSRDEALIAFSNHHVYHDSLVTFPGVGGEGLGVSAVVVDGGATREREESVAAEASRVVDLVIEHARTRPEESLGVIALGVKHARRIEAALDLRRRELPDLDAFFAEDRPDRFFVKNLERVQGDERDAIIITLGAGKDAGGRISNVQFGPLNGEGGRRRLNVAVTRARRRLLLVSSFSHFDMNPAGDGSGTELLRHYLRYAASGGRELGAGAVSGVPLNPFEADIYDTLRAAGIPLVPQLGASQYRLDFAAQHPTQPGRFVLALEGDGASYHSAPTARDRDRLRQQHLEALGWKFHRIWSTDWFSHKEEEVARAVAAYRAAVAGVAEQHRTEPAALAAGSIEQPMSTGSRPADPERTQRPRIGRRESIADYAPRELDAMVRWVVSDGILRTDDDILDEVRAELGFTRNGPRIEAAIRAAMRRVMS